MKATPEQIMQVYRLTCEATVTAKQIERRLKLSRDVVRCALVEIRAAERACERQRAQAERYDTLLSQAHPWRDVERGKTSVRPYQDDRGPAPCGMRLGAFLSVLLDRPRETVSTMLPMGERTHEIP